VSDRRLRLAVAAVALAGAGVAGYLTWVHYQPGVLVCTSGGGCETVQESDYATIAGVPVALLGLLAYAVVLGLTAVDTPTTRAVTAAIALGAAAFAAYLVVLQAFVIHAWCIWCLVNDVLIVPALAILGVLRLRETERPTSSAPGAAPSV
jgi:uncharacterized membrane protein